MMLIGIALGMWSVYHVTQPIGEPISVREVLQLANALEENRQDGKQNDISLQEAMAQDIIWKSEEIDGDSDLTYEQYLWILSYFGMEDTIFIDKYKESFSVLKEDWYTSFDILRKELGCQELVVDMPIEILGIGEMAKVVNGAELEENQLLTDQGIFTYDVIGIEEMQYQSILTIMVNGEVISIREVVDDAMKLSKVWVMEVTDDYIICFINQHEVKIPITQSVKAEREEVSDLLFEKGKLDQVVIKDQKYNGKLLGIKDGTLEIEGVGTYPMAEEMKVYKLYGQLESYTVNDLRIGYAFSDYVIDQGEVVACLVVHDEFMEHIRVLLKTSDFKERVHESVSFYGDCDLEIAYGGEKTELVPAGELVTVDRESVYLKEGRIRITPVALTGRVYVSSIERNQGMPSYRGVIELSKNEDGIIIINEILLEEYLYAVVPSEMPKSYPNEALKSQAICARTYAYGNMLHSGLPSFGAHVDDSTGFQVYNNINEQLETTTAVKETKGKVLTYENQIINAYYYSTSCGYGTNADVWNPGMGKNYPYLLSNHISVSTEESMEASALQEENVFREYISTVHEEDYEKEEGWYRWTYDVILDDTFFLEKLQDRYEKHPNKILTLQKDGSYESQSIEDMGSLLDLKVEKRNHGGIMEELLLEFEEGEVKVLTELVIRYVLCNGESPVILQTETEYNAKAILPSAFFVIDTEQKDGKIVKYHLLGGGFGHGVGMSQNGAKAMANQGCSSQEILELFYGVCEVKDIY